MNNAEVTTRARLEKAIVAIDRLQSRLDTLESARTEPIAIVGLSCRFPGGESPEAFWDLLATGREGVREISPDRWNVDAYFDPDPAAPGKMHVRRAGLLDRLDLFDPAFFGITPREAMTLDPQQRLLLEVTWEALERAGIAPEKLAGTATGVYLGIIGSDYAQLVARQGVAAIDAHVGTGTSPAAAAGRLSYLLGLQGPCVTIDTACSSSLVAVSQACDALRAGQCDAALVGGVNAIVTPEPMIFESKARMLAPDGRCKTFDAAADGFTRGEGCGIIVLKRLRDARRDGDRVLALIRGCAVNQDGRSSGLTVPNGLAQQAVIRAALAAAGVAPGDIHYVEAHGTGTSLGDPIEVQALAAVLGTGRAQPLLIGSVKTNIGHLEAAAGIAGLIKVVLALQHELLPPHLHFHTPNPHVAWQALPVRVTATATPWPTTSARRLAGVSSFGFSGTNAHVVLEEAGSEPAERGDTVDIVRAVESLPVAERPAHLLAISARSEAALLELAERYARHLETSRDSLAAVCHAATTERSHFEHRLALVVSTRGEAAQALAAIKTGTEQMGIHRGHVEDRPRLAFSFCEGAGIGPNLGKELFEIEPTFREAIQRCESLLKQPSLLGRSLSDPVAQFALQFALAQVWQGWGIRPDVFHGKGVGALVAACLKGTRSLDDSLRLAATETVSKDNAPLLSDCDIILELGSGEEPEDRQARNGSASSSSRSVRTLHSGVDEWTGLLQTLAELYVAGVSVDWSGFHRHHPQPRVLLPTYPFQRQRYWIDAVPEPAPKPVATAPASSAALARLLADTSPGQQAAVLATHVRSRMAEVLRILPDAIPDRAGFFELGMDSLLAVELRESLQQAIGDAPVLSSTVVFDHPTLSRLTQHLTELLLPQLAGHRDASAEVFAKRRHDEPIAIVGLGCRFPGAANPESFWQLLDEGRDAIGEVPLRSWDLADYYDPNPDAAGKMYCRFGGFLDEVDRFDAAFFGISSREAIAMDPQHRLVLETAWEALEQGGHAPASLLGSRTGVFLGISANDYAALGSAGGPATLDAYFASGSALSAAAGRLAFTLGLQGPATAIDTACSSSLVAVHQACRSLTEGECNLALAGGVNLVLNPLINVTLSRARMLAADGRCKTFDAAADGYVRSEGCGIVVLKRLSDAERDGDHILALIRGTAVNQDGRSGGLTVPNGPAQQAAIREALANGAVAPQEIEYVEAHGTGTSLGDPIEVQALAAVLGQARAKPLLLGSVKTNIGHLEAAAGIAGLIKVVLALQHDRLPRHLHLDVPNPRIPWDTLPVEVVTESRSWPRGASRRLAGISSFGFIGTNAHVVVEEAPADGKRRSHADTRVRSQHVLILSARSEAALEALAGSYLQYLEGSGESLGAICQTAAVGRSHFEHRCAIVAESVAEACAQLKCLCGSRDQSDGAATSMYRGRLDGKPRPRVAWGFPSEMHALASVARALFERAPVFRQAIVRCAERLTDHLSRPLPEMLFGDNPLPLESAGVAQFAVQYSLAELWQSWGVVPDVMFGQGSGFLAAACVAGVLSLEDALRLSLACHDRVELDRLAATVHRSSPRIRLICGTTGKEIEDLTDFRVSMGAGPACPVDHGCGITLEIGPSAPKGAGKDDHPLADLSLEAGDERALLQALAQLHVAGVPIDWAGVYRDHPQPRLSLPTYPFQRQSYWIPATWPRVSGRSVHPLLGECQSMAAGEVVHVGRLDPVLHPFLNDHRLYDTVVVPGAAWAALILAAGGVPGRLRDLQFHAPMLLDSGRGRAFQLRLDRADASGGRSVTVHGADESSERGWIQHATGRWEPCSATAVPEEPIESLRGGLRERSVDDICATLAGLGLELGPAFRSVRCMWSSAGEALGELVVPQALAATANLPVHPAVLDACSQVALATLKTVADVFYAPLEYQKLELCQPVPARFYCHARARVPSSEETRSFDLRLLGETGQVIGKLDGLTVKKAPRESFLRGLRSQLSSWFYEITWEPRPRPERSTSFSLGQVRVQVPAPLAERLARASRKYQTVLPDLETAATGYAVAALRELGARLEPGQSMALSRLGVASRHQRLASRVLQMLEEDGVVQRVGDDDWEVTRDPGKIEPRTRLVRVHEDPEARIEAQLLERCGSHLTAVLRGAADPLPLLFPSDAAPSAEAMYQGSVGAQAFNELVAETVAAAVAGWPGERKLRILEIGAGTGGTTAALLPRLSAERIEYLFTDISAAFLTPAQSRFADFPFVTYQVLDIEQDPLAQGLKAQNFDLVLAANVLHATADLRQSLATIRSLLKPGGLLVLIETTRRQRWIDLIFGLLGGWWRFRDRDLRPNHPLLPANDWLRLLSSERFTDVVHLPDRDDIGQTLFLARAAVTEHVQPASIGRLLVCGDSEGVAGALAHRGQNAASECVVLDAAVPREGEEWNRVFHRAGPLQAVVYEAPAEDACVGLLELAKALIREASPPRLVVLTRGSQAVVPGDTVDGVAHGALWGLCQVIASEHPELRTLRIDLDPSVDAARSAADVLEELSIADDEDQVAFRGNARLVRRLVRSHRSTPVPVVLNPAGTYLVTGGLGGLGLLTAQHLARRGARHLVLVGRSAPTPAAAQAIAEMERLGTTVVVVQADVSRREDMAALFARMGHSLPPLRGIVHSAGVLDDGVLRNQARDRLEKVFAPKVEGAKLLHELAQGRQLDFFVLYSSVADLLGSAGQSNHAAANAYLDALAHHRRARGLPAVSINWGAWSEVGAAAKRDVADRIGKHGLGMIDPKSGLAALEWALGQEVAQVAVLPADWSKFASQGTTPPFLRHLLKATATPLPAMVADHRGTVWSERLRSAAGGDRRKLLVGYLQQRVAQVLGNAELPEPRTGFFDLGMDSLMAVELRNRVQSDMGGVSLSATAVFDHPTVEALATYLADIAPAPAAPRVQPPPVSAEPIAIVGMACRFPGGASPDQFWQLLHEGREAVREISADRWDIDAYYDPDPDAPGKMYVRRAALLEHVDRFDPAFFGIAPREAAALDPQQRLLLEVSWEALEAAALSPQRLSGARTGVYIGISGSDYGQLLSQRGDHTIDAYLGLGSSPASAAGRLSYVLGLQGPCVAIDTACSSSLVAVSQACDALRTGRCDAALAAGVNAIVTPVTMIAECKARMLSPDGRCKTFDASANGFVRGEGCGVIVLKRLSDAQRAGDRIFAMIRGSAINQDGRSSGLTVPNGPAQQAVVREALDLAGVSPHEVAYVEAHGTGTSLGDPIEVQALAAVMSEGREQPLLVGSVKTNVGHLEAAAGMAGLFKVVLALEHERIPRHLHVTTPNPHIPWGALLVKVASEETPWPRGNAPRIAGVSSFGFSGTNAHVVLQEAPRSSMDAAVERPLHLLPLSARTDLALRELAENYARHLETSADSLGDICFTASTGRAHFSHRLAMLVESREDVCGKLTAFSRGRQVPGIRTSGGVRREGLADESSVEEAVRRLADRLHGQPSVNSASNHQTTQLPDEGWTQALDQLGELFASGADIDWSAFYRGSAWRKVALPCYPFQRQRFWIAPRPTQRPTGNAHPLLGHLTRSAVNDDAIVDTLLSVESLPWLADHCINGTPILPATAYLEAALAAARPLYPEHALALAEVEFSEPLVLSPNGSRRSQLVLKRIEGDVFDWTFYGRADGDTNEPWSLHARGRVVRGDAIATSENLEGLRARCSEPVPIEAIRETFARRGLGYGPHFHGLVELRRGQNEAVGRVHFPEAFAGECPEYGLHPAILDACVQVCAGVLPSVEDDVLLPFAFDRVQIEPKPATSLWCCASLRDRSADGATFDLDVFEESGRVVARLAGLRLRRAAWADQRQPMETAGWLHQVVWEPLTSEPEYAREKVQRLILSDASNVTGALFSHANTVAMERSRGSGWLEQCLRWLQETNGTTGEVEVIFLACRPESDPIETCVELLELVQALMKYGSDRPPRLVLVTQGAQAVTLEERCPGFRQASLWGLGRVVAREHPELRCLCVDLESSEDAAGQLGHVLLRSNSAGEDQVACRGSECFAPRLVRSKPPPADAAILRTDATYLITGGLGGLGILAAQHLAERGARHLILMGRSQPGEEAARVIAELRGAGVDVVLMQSDIGLADDVRCVLSGISSALPLRGVIHAAGVLDDGVLLNQTRERFERVLAPKVRGAWNLHEQTRDLDFFILYSSSASLLAPAGQGNYAAANAYLDALAHYRHACGLPALSINWGAWSEVGVAARAGAESDAARSGLGSIAPREGLAVLDRVLASSRPQVGVLPANWALVFRNRTVPPFFSRLVASRANSAGASVELARRLQETAPDERQQLLIDYVQRQTAHVLGQQAGVLPDVRTGFFELGMDSLMAVELRNRLQTDLGSMPLRATAIFDHPNVEALARHLAEILEPSTATAVPRVATPRMSSEPIAIIGLACRFPGGEDAEAFWRLLAEGRDALREFPPERWDINAYYDSDSDAPGKMYVRRAALLEHLDRFDPAFFGIAPREAVSLDPQQRLLLEVAWEALEDAGLSPRALEGNPTGVYVGISGSDYGNLLTQRGGGAIDAYLGTGTSPAAAAGRISYVLGLQGPCVAIDTACSSSLVAVSQACDALRAGRCDAALAGGVHAIVTPESTIFECKARMLAPDGCCKTFDAAADGFARGEGCGLVVLKRLSDARQAGDRILAVIRGSAVNQDGRSGGLTVPNGAAQQAVVREALAVAGLAGHEVQYVEAHGTGTSLGDPIEIQALGASLGSGRSAPLLVGSVKTNVGHLEAAAGVAGLIKVVLALQHEQIPPHLHLTNPNPHIPWDELPIRVTTTATPWPRGPRIAGVSSFGFSGTNAHVIVEAASGSKASPATPERPLHLLALSARDEAALQDLVHRYEKYLETTSEPFADICFTANAGRAHFEERLAVIASTAAEARLQLAQACHRGRVVGGQRRRIAFHFSGEIDSRTPGRTLLDTEPRFRKTVRHCQEELRLALPHAVIDDLFAEPTSQPEIATFVLQYALAELLRQWGIRPDRVTGEGIGEYVAACLTGGLELQEAFRLLNQPSHARDGWRENLPAALDGELLQVTLPGPGDDAWLALLNSMAQLFVAGVPVDLAALDAGHSRRKVRLPSYPFQRQRYWVPEPAKARHPSSVHPLLGTVTRSAVHRDFTFEASVTVADLGWPGDHRVNGSAVLPAAAYLEAALAAAHIAFPSSDMVIEQVDFREPLRLPDEGGVTLQTVFVPGTNDLATWKLFSGDGTQWSLHAQGNALPMQKRDLPTESLANVQARCVRDVPVSSLHDACADRGLAYGPSFRGLVELRRGESEALGRIRLPDSVLAQARDYRMHPVLLDACVQVCVAALPADEDAGMQLPFTVEHMALRGRCQGPLWCAARPRVSDATQNLTFDLILWDDAQQVLGEVRGLGMRRVAEPKRTSLDDWMYTVAWQPLPTPPAQRPRGRRLVFNDPTGVGRFLVEGDTVTVEMGSRFEHLGSGRYQLDPMRPEQMKALLEATTGATAPFHDILYLWGIDVSEANVAAACAGLLHLVKSLARTAAPAPVRLWIVTRNVHAVLPGERPGCPAQGVLWGLGRVVRHEHPELDCRCLDVDGDDIASMLADLAGADEEDQVAYRGNQRYGARFLPGREAARMPTGAARLAIAQRGSPDHLDLVALERPAPARGEVEIEVHAAGLNFLDVMDVLGILPFARPALGNECAGRIAAIGEGVTDYKVGDEVIALAPGCFATHVRASVELTVRKPPALSFAEAATLPVAFLTAHEAFHRLGELRAGQKVLIHAAAGGVGLAALQLAQRAGAEVHASASPGKHAYLRSLGVKYLYNSRTTDFADEVRRNTDGQGVDLVLNSLTSGDFIARSLSALAPGGCFLEMSKRDIWSAEQVREVRPDVSYAVVALERLLVEEPQTQGAALRTLVDEVASGRLPPLPVTEFALSEARLAFRFMQQARHVGKIVFRVPQLLAATIRPDATYLITGGLGGLGLLTAQRLAERGAHHLALVGRRPPSAEAQAALAGLRDMEVEAAVFQADIAREDDVARVLAEIGRTMPPLRGIVHAAGVLDDGVLLNQNMERFEKVLAPKVAGAWNLHEQTLPLSLDFFVLYSSVASLLGPMGQGNYAAANAYLDALAQRRRAESLPALSINWGAWSEVGMAARNGVLDQARDRGMGTLDPATGLDAFERAFAFGPMQVAVLPADWRQIERQAATRPPFLSRVLGSRARGDDSTQLLANLRGLAPTRQLERLLEHVQRRVARVLGRDPSSLPNPRTGFFEMGMDSLMAVELRGLLQSDLDGMALGVSAVFDHPSSEALAIHLAGLVAEHPSTPPPQPSIPVAEVAELDHLDQLSAEELVRRLDQEVADILGKDEAS